MKIYLGGSLILILMEVIHVLVITLRFEGLSKCYLCLRVD
jgi:hypothetical protein